MHCADAGYLHCHPYMFLTCSCQVASALTSQQQERCPNDPSKAEEPLSGQFSTPFAVPFVNATVFFFPLAHQRG